MSTPRLPFSLKERQNVSCDKASSQPVWDGGKNAVEVDDLYRAIFHGFPEAILLTDDHTGIVACNAAATGLLGNAGENLKEKRLADFASEMVPGGERWSELLRSGNHEGVVSLAHPEEGIIDVHCRATAHILPKCHMVILRKFPAAELLSRGIGRDILIPDEESIILADKNGRLVWWNPAFESLCGHSFRQTGDSEGNPLSLSAPDTVRLLQDSLLSQRPFSFEFTSRQKDGRLQKLQVTASPLNTHMGDIPAFVGLVRDLQKPWASDALYRLLAENSHDLLTLHASDGNCIFANQSLFRALGYQWSDIEGSVGFVHPEDRHSFVSFLQRQGVGKAGSSRLVCRFTKKDGQILWFETLARAFSSPTGDKTILTTSRDITSRREAQEALKESEEQFRLVFDSLPIPMVLASRETWELLEGNKAFERLLDLRASELTGVALWSFAKSGDSSVTDLLRQLDVTGRSVSQPILLSQGKGDSKMVIISAVVLQQRSGICHVLCALDDITDRARTEREIQDYRQTLEVRNSQLEQMLRETSRLAEEASAASIAKTAFLAAVSHEIRTPLHGIVGAADLLADFPLPEDMRELVATIRSCGNSLTSLINGLLDFSSIEGGRLRCESAPFSPRHLVEAVRGVLLPRASAKRIPLSCRVGPGVPSSILGDSQRVEQVLLNLVDNAVKFTEQGQVELGVDLCAIGDSGPRICFWVKDSGPGIPTEIHQEVFAPFVQGDASPSRRYGGVGLGLAISRELARLMKGEVRLEESGPEGSRFVFFIPLQEAPEQESRLREEPAPAFVRKAETPALRILIVEDNQVNQRIASLMLSKAGFTVQVASDGQEALTILSQQAFDAVLMDCQMPILDGYETTRCIRSSDSSVLDPAIPIIAMTGNAMAGDREKCLAAGMTDYLTKPVKMVAIREVLARCLPQHFEKA